MHNACETAGVMEVDDDTDNIKAAKGAEIYDDDTDTNQSMNEEHNDPGKGMDSDNITDTEGGNTTNTDQVVVTKDDTDMLLAPNISPENPISNGTSNNPGVEGQSRIQEQMMWRLMNSLPATTQEWMMMCMMSSPLMTMQE
jgi:hypothetical protein